MIDGAGTRVSSTSLNHGQTARTFFQNGRVMTHVRLRLCHVLTAAASGWLAAPAGAQSAADASKAAVVGYASNVQAFPYYKCRYKLTQAMAETPADFANGKWSDKKSFEAIYVVDGEYELFKRDGALPPKKNVKPGKDGLAYVPVDGFSALTFLRSATGVAGYSRGLDVINLTRAENTSDFQLDVGTPLDMGILGNRHVRGPDRLLARPAEFAPTFLGKQNVNGLPLIGLRFANPKAGAVYEFWLDPARGYLPARYEETFNGNVITRTELRVAKEFKPGRWFPTDVISFYPTHGRQEERHFIEIRVLDVDVERRPTPEDLSVKIPAGTQVCEFGRKGVFYLKQDETVSSRGVSELFEKLDRSRTERHMDTALTAQQPPSRWWVWPLAGGGGACVLCGGVLWYRKRRPAVA